MKFLVDEDLPNSLAENLNDEGFDATHVRTEGLRSKPDSEIISYADRKGFAVITRDSDYGNPELNSPPEKGVLILRLPDYLPDKISERAIEFLEKSGFDRESKVVVLEPGRYRTRKLG